MARDVKFGTGPKPTAVELKGTYSADIVAPTLPTAASGTITSAQTAAIGSNWGTFNSAVCDQLDIVNNTGTTIEYRRGGAGSTMQIRDGSSRLVIGITNANQIDVRRVDQSNTQVTVSAEAFVV